MHPIFGGELIDGFFFFQDFQRNLRLLTGGKVFSRGYGVPGLHFIFAHFRIQISLTT